MKSSNESSGEQGHPDPKTFDEEMQLLRCRQEYQGKAHRDVITSRLAIVLAALLGVSLVAHYVTTAYFASKADKETVEALRSIFNAWLPVLSGLVGAAVAHYFAKDR